MSSCSRWLMPAIRSLVPALATLPLISVSSYAAVDRPIDGSYKLVFRDEFESATLDAKVWTPNWLGCQTCITPPVQTSNEVAAYDPKRVSMSNGQLQLNIIDSPVVVNGKTYPYRSGMIQSHNKKKFTYGYFEAKIYLPVSGQTNRIANWPAWWTDGENWPEDGENDVIEGLGGGDACFHFHSPSGGPGGCAKGYFTGWHVYGSLWERGKVTYYYDGVKVGTITSGITASPMYLILNYGLSTEHGGAPRVPATMRVEYVRVWQKM